MANGSLPVTQAARQGDRPSKANASLASAPTDGPAETERATPVLQGPPTSGRRLVPCQLMVPRFVAAGGQRLAVLGNVTQLGAWRPSQAVPLEPSEHNETMHVAIVQLPLGDKIEAKVQMGGGHDSVVQLKCDHVNVQFSSTLMIPPALAAGRGYSGPW